MRKWTGILLTLTALAGGVFAEEQPGEKPRLLHLLQDDAQEPMVTRIFELKNVSAGDLTPFVLGLVKRYNTNSAVDRLKYGYGKKQFLIVTTPSKMMKCIEEIIPKLDHAGGKLDPSGSIVAGTGIARFTYQPRFRSSEEMVNISNRLIRAAGYAFRDSSSNLIYWKDTNAVGKYIGMWMRVFDHPLPQVELVFKVYEVRQSQLNDIGIDYLAWKNGPGLNMLSFGFESISVDTVENAFSNMDMFSSWSYGGMFVAPKFDMSFIRMLSQKGSAKISSTASLTVINNYTGSYYVRFAPENQNLSKDDRDRTYVVAGASNSFNAVVSSPVICFRRTGEVDTSYIGDGFNFTTFSSLGGSVQFKYELTSNDVVERNNRGTELTDRSYVSSSLTADIGMERLLAVYKRQQAVEQTVGVPFLSDIPVVKYLFSTTTKVNEDVKLFVTVNSRLLHPQDTFAPWSGRLLSTEDFIKEITSKE